MRPAKPFKVEVFEHDALDFLVMRTSGRFSAPGMFDAQARIATHPRIRAGDTVLNDLRRVDFRIDQSEVIDAARGMRYAKAGAPENRVAIVVADDLAFGFIRMYCAFRQVTDWRSVHREVVPALDWLGQPGDLEPIVDDILARREAVAE